MQTRNDKHAKTFKLHFDSLYELGKWIDTTPSAWGSRYDSAHSNPPALDWDLRAGYDGAKRMAREGWLEGAEKMQDALKAFTLQTPAPDTKTDFYGFRPHVARFCAGAPDSMVRHTTEAESGAGRVLTLVVSICANAYSSAVRMSNFGVAVAQYVNQMEMDGTRVELVAAFSDQFHKSGVRATYAVTIKHADQPLDLAVVAFVIGHPAMLRRLGFSLIERTPVTPESGYGHSCDSVVEDLINPAPGTVILNGMTDADRHAPTPEDGFKYVSEQIEKAMEANYNAQYL